MHFKFDLMRNFLLAHCRGSMPLKTAEKCIFCYERYRKRPSCESLDICLGITLKPTKNTLYSV